MRSRCTRAGYLGDALESLVQRDRAAKMHEQAHIIAKEVTCVCVCVCVFDRHMKKRRGGDAKNSERACARKREIRERGSLLGTVLNNGGSRASPGTEEVGAGRVGECTGWG